MKNEELLKTVSDEWIKTGMKLDFGFWEDLEFPKPRTPNSKTQVLIMECL